MVSTPPASDLLDVAPFPWAHPDADRLRDTLVEAYTSKSPDHIRRVVERAGFAIGEVNWDQALNGLWGEVLEAGAGQARNRQLLTAVLSDPTCSAYHARLRRILDWPSLPDRPEAEGGDLPDALQPLLDALRSDGVSAALDPAVVEPARRYAPRAARLTEYRLARVAYWKQPKYDHQIDPNFTRLTLILDRGERAEGVRWQARDREFDDLGTLLDSTAGTSPALVLIGEPGCGKTTLLSRLALQHAVAGLGVAPKEDPSGGDGAETTRAEQPIASSDPPAVPAPIVFFLSLAEYDPSLSPRDFLAGRWAERFAAMPPLEKLLAGEAPVLLLLDALNEMPHADAAEFEAQVAAWRSDLQRLVEDRPSVRVLFSCRSLDYSGGLSSDALPVPHVRIERLSDAQVMTYLGQHVPDAAEEVWAQLQAAPKQLDLFRTPYYLQLLCEQVGPKGELPPGRAALFTGFVRRALARELGRGTPGFAAGALLDSRDCKRIRSGRWPSAHALPEGGSLLPRLARLAYDMQRRGGATSRGQVTITLDQARALLRRTDGEATATADPAGDAAAGGVDPILAAGAALGMLDIDDLADRLRFAHQLIQEFFAARVLAPAPDLSLLHVPWRVDEVAESLAETRARIPDSEPLPPLPATGWEESAVMAAEMMSAEDAAAFTWALAEIDLPTAARCAAAPAVHVADAVAGELRSALIARCEDEDADLRARIAAGHALGRLGDPRFERREGPHGAHLYPSLVSVSAGRYPIGADDITADERPPHDVELPGFAIGRFPVTNAEYAHFVDGGGYEDERWWVTDTPERGFAVIRRAWRLRGPQRRRSGRAFRKTTTVSGIGCPECRSPRSKSSTSTGIDS